MSKPLNILNVADGQPDTEFRGVDRESTAPKQPRGRREVGKEGMVGEGRGTPR
jgi:hypothetical protein